MMLFFDCSGTTRKHKLSGSAKKRLAERELYFSLRCYENLPSFSQNCMIKSKFQMLFSMTATRQAWASTLSNDNSSSARRSRKRPGVATFSDHRPSSTKKTVSRTPRNIPSTFCCSKRNCKELKTSFGYLTLKTLSR